MCPCGLVLPSRFERIDAQTPPTAESNRDERLRIDSPRDGAVVASGETLQVTVSSPNRTRFLGITIVMEDPIDTTDQEAASLPAHFAIKIPRSIKAGLYSLSAVAGLAGTITAVGAGHATIVAWYGPRDRGITASFAVEVRLRE
jgi:hypothetical protein